MACIAVHVWPYLCRGSLFAAMRLLQTVRLDNACITNAHHCSFIPACVHFAHRVRKSASKLCLLTAYKATASGDIHDCIRER